MTGPSSPAPRTGALPVPGEGTGRPASWQVTCTDVPPAGSPGGSAARASTDRVNATTATAALTAPATAPTTVQTYTRCPSPPPDARPPRTPPARGRTCGTTPVDPIHPHRSG